MLFVGVLPQRREVCFRLRASAYVDLPMTTIERQHHPPAQLLLLLLLLLIFKLLIKLSPLPNQLIFSTCFLYNLLNADLHSTHPASLSSLLIHSKYYQLFPSLQLLLVICGINCPPTHESRHQHTHTQTDRQIVFYILD